MEQFEEYLTPVFIILYIIIGWPIIKKAVRNILRAKDIFDENFLMCVASIGSICVGEAEEALMVMLLYRIGEFLQAKAVGKSRRAISDLMDIMPDYANVLLADGQTEKKNPSDFKVGDVIVVLPGERIPLDGEIIEGTSRIDTAALTGESLPLDAEIGSSVQSGTINLDGALKVKVTKSSKESTASKIINLVEDAASNRAQAENFITKFARIYTPVVCACALLIAIVPPLIVGGWADWIHRGLTFLVISCPCALVISIPLGFFGGIGCASNHGILIKGSNYLEALSKAEAVVFDKTGTLTKGVFKVVAVHPHAFTEEKVLELAAHAESFSNHPIARSLADEFGKPIDKSIVKDAHEFAGKGITATVDDLVVSCGNSKMMDMLGITYHDCEIPGTTVHVVIEGAYAGHITISDQVKDDAKNALSSLKALGIRKLVMLTGDKEVIAKSVADNSALLPEDKVNLTKKLISEKTAKRSVAFVGDGINDAPVLVAADVGLAMGGMGQAAAVEAADIVLMNDKPSDVATAIKIAKKTMRIVRENIWFSIGIKLVVLITAALGFDPMWLAIFADVGVCLLAILNSIRALKI
ncbi:MAG: heavy metal translocating P-type ATPase [Bacillota bacterium]|nr:heavy metal translocating P-type ATPase [Bacillota bacterium]